MVSGKRQALSVPYVVLESDRDWDRARCTPYHIDPSTTESKIPPSTTPSMIHGVGLGTSGGVIGFKTFHSAVLWEDATQVRSKASAEAISECRKSLHHVYAFGNSACRSSILRVPSSHASRPASRSGDSVLSCLAQASLNPVDTNGPPFPSAKYSPAQRDSHVSG